MNSITVKTADFGCDTGRYWHAVRWLFSVMFLVMLMAGGAEAAAPDAPTSVTVRAGDTNALVRWIAPINTSGLLVTSYTATASSGGASCTSNSGTPVTPSCTINGLSNNTAYTFTVTATTADGTSVSSIASAAATPLAGTENINLLSNFIVSVWI